MRSDEKPILLKQKGFSIGCGAWIFTPHQTSLVLHIAAGLGLEPRLHGSEPCVLPLDDPAAICMTLLYNTLLKFCLVRGGPRLHDSEIKL